MLSLTQINKAVNDLLKKKTNAETYSNEVLEGFKTPCFFTSCRIADMETVSQNNFLVKAVVSIIFIPDTQQMKRVRSESYNNKMASLLIGLFLPNIKVEDRTLTVSRISTDFVGENSDLLRFNFTTEYYDSFDISDEETKLLIEEIFLQGEINTGKEDF